MVKKNNISKGEVSPNRQYKDSVFTLLFSDLEKLAEIYGAISGQKIELNKIKLETLERVLSNGIYNDIAFTVNNKLVVLIEHQSTINENMPLRMLLYIAEIYNRLLGSKNLYRPDLFKIQRPVFIVLYNGNKDVPDKQILRLSDMFEQTDEATGIPDNLELTVTVYNINKGHNLEMAKRSPTLDGYETFIYKVRENLKTGITLEEAIKNAVDDCIKQNILKTFFQKYEREVIKMLFQEWDLDTALAVAEESGERKNTLKIAKKMKDAGESINKIIEFTGLTVDDIIPL